MTTRASEPFEVPLGQAKRQVRKMPGCAAAKIAARNGIVKFCAECMIASQKSGVLLMQAFARNPIGLDGELAIFIQIKLRCCVPAKFQYPSKYDSQGWVDTPSC